MSWLETLRRTLYLTQRTIGDAQAASRGPDKLAKRLVRRSLVRAFWKGMGL
jgi:hypothetical protein